jgi:hypothetical protein
MVSFKKIRPWLISLLVIASVMGCEWRSDIRHEADDPEYMARLKQGLREDLVPFRENEDGSIEYGWDVKEKVDAVQDRISRVVAFQLDEPSRRAVAMKVLEELGQDPREELKPDGAWVEWYPRSESEKVETERRVRQALLEFDASGSRAGPTPIDPGNGPAPSKQN